MEFLNAVQTRRVVWKTLAYLQWLTNYLLCGCETAASRQRDHKEEFRLTLFMTDFIQQLQTSTFLAVTFILVIFRLVLLLLHFQLYFCYFGESLSLVHSFTLLSHHLDLVQLCLVSQVSPLTLIIFLHNSCAHTHTHKHMCVCVCVCRACVCCRRRRRRRLFIQ